MADRQYQLLGILSSIPIVIALMALGLRGGWVTVVGIPLAIGLDFGGIWLDTRPTRDGSNP